MIGLLLMSPVTCTNADGSTVQMDNPGSGVPFADSIPFLGGNGQPCTDNPAPAAQAAGAVANSVVGDTVKGIVDWIESAMSDVATSVASFWTSTPTTSVGGQDGHPSDSVAFIQDAMKPYMLILATISLIIGGVILAYRGKVTLPQLGGFMLRIASVGVLTTAVCALLIGAADEFSQWVIPAAAANGSDLGANLALLFANVVTGPVGLICLIIELLSSVFLVAIMFVRSAMLILLVGTIGIAACVWSPSFYIKQAKLTLVVILVKPAAALVFAVGFRLLGTNISQQGVTEAITGATILLTACWSYKFLSKLILPWDDPMGQTGLGGVVARAAMFAAIVA